MTRPSKTTELLPAPKWNDLTPLRSPDSLSHALSLGTSIWLMTQREDGSQKLVEYDCITDTFNEAIRTSYSNVCTYKNDTILIAANQWGIFTFNIETKTFSEPVKMPDVGGYATIFAVGDYIHIIHGHENPHFSGRPPHKYIIFSMKDRTVKTFEDKDYKYGPYAVIHAKAIQHHGVNEQRTKTVIAGFGRIHFKEEIAVVVVSLIFQFLKMDKFYKFGGSNNKDCANRSLDTFFIGSLQDDNGAAPVQWSETLEYSIKTDDDKLRSPPQLCVFRNVSDIVILGVIHPGASGAVERGNIYVSIIDPNGEQECMREWIQSPIYEYCVHAVVMDFQGNVHFFGDDYKIGKKADPKTGAVAVVRTHHAIPLQYIIDNAVVVT